MGCVQAKPSPTSPRRLGIERLKADGGYQGRRLVGPASAEREEGEGGVVEVVSRRIGVMEMMVEEEEMVDGWPRWLVNNVPKEGLGGLVLKSADSYVMIGKVGQGTYSNVYKARDRDTGKIVALKKVRFDTSESESIRFMAREIMILQKLDHPNVLKLEGLATSRLQYSLYLVFEYMQSDLARIISRPDQRLTEPQVKCYMHQLLSGLQHCHERGILHRDIKGSNLLIDKHGMLKIGDFGLANYFSPNQKMSLTSRVVTLWYRAPELLLGATDYGAGIDLWSAGCLLAEMFAGRPIMPGRTEVEQLHRIFKLCGSPPEEYWRKLKLSNNFRPPQPYESSITEAFRDFPSSSLGLLTSLLALEPAYRGSAASALQSEFFSTSPLACDLSGLPVIYKDKNDDSILPRERRKRRSSKLKQRSQSHKEQMKLNQDVNIPKADSSSSKEEEKSGEMTNSFGPSSSTASSSSKYATTSPQNESGDMTTSSGPSSSAASSSSKHAATSPPFPLLPTTFPLHTKSPSLPLPKQSPPSLSKRSMSSDYRTLLAKNIMDLSSTVFHPSAARNIMNLPNTEYHPSTTRHIMKLLPKTASTICITDTSDEGLDGMQIHPSMEKKSASMSDDVALARDHFSNTYDFED